MKKLWRSLSVASVLALAMINPSGVQAQYYWLGGGTNPNNPADASNWNGASAPTFGAANTNSFWTCVNGSTMTYGTAQGTTTLGTGGGTGSLTWIGFFYPGSGGAANQSTVQVTGGTLNLNGSFSGDGGTASLWVGNGFYYSAFLNINGGTVNTAYGTVIGRDTAYGTLSVANGSFTTGLFSSSYGTLIGGVSGSTGTGSIMIGNGGRFTLSGASANPFLFGGSLTASVANTSGDFIDFTAGSSGRITLNLSAATLGTNYFNNLIANGYVEIGGVVDTKLSDYNINIQDWSDSILTLSVPEPSSGVLLVGGLVLFTAFRRRAARRKHK